MNLDLLSMACMTVPSSSTTKDPASKLTPSPFSKPIPGPVSLRSKPAAKRVFMDLSESSWSLIHFHRRDSRRPSSAALAPSAPKETNLDLLSSTSTNSLSCNALPAPATCTWSVQPVSASKSSRVHFLGGSVSMALSILRSLLPRSITTPPRSRTMLLT